MRSDCAVVGNMKIHHGIERITERISRAVVTIGNFDGVHLGHQELLRRTGALAGEIGGTSVAMTFWPHPVSLFKPGTFVRIQTLEERLALLESFGMDHAVVVEFSRDLADLVPAQFLHKVMLKTFDLEHVVLGWNTTFGKGRAGDVNTMKEFGQDVGFGVHSVDPVMHGGEPISSSRIRRAVASGEVDQAAIMLGRPYRLSGPVVKGFQRGGRLLGFPTANIHTKAPLVPARGVYAAWTWLGETRYKGALNIGVNPTFGNESPTVEVHLLDFDRDIYGETLSVEPMVRIRPEQKFDGLSALKTQIAEDVRKVDDVLR